MEEALCKLNEIRKAIAAAALENIANDISMESIRGDDCFMAFVGYINNNSFRAGYARKEFFFEGRREIGSDMLGKIKSQMIKTIGHKPSAEKSGNIVSFEFYVKDKK